MRDNHLYTVRDIARELGLPESTVRYYRDAFAAYVPAVGTGRRRRYPTEAVPVLRLVAEGYAQNRPRAEIERALTESLGAPVGGRSVTVIAPRWSGGDLHRDELLATILDGERERREVMWQMARELVRLGETIERQHVLLSRLAEQVSARERALPVAPPAPVPVAASVSEPATPLTTVVEPDGPSEVARELEELRRELTRERELVERLRRSKLDVERRAAEAEARLNDGGSRPGRRGLLGRLLTRQDEPRR